jgi:hypothetical protein
LSAQAAARREVVHVVDHFRGRRPGGSRVGGTAAVSG